MNTLVDVVPFREEHGRAVTIREIIILLGSDLMRTDGIRVVSAWNQMSTLSVKADLEGKDAYDQFCDDLHARVCSDIGTTRSHAGFDTFWTYGPYVELCRHFGEQWPVETLTAYLRLFGAGEMVAQEVWDRAVFRYGVSAFLSGEPTIETS